MQSSSWTYHDLTYIHIPYMPSLYKNNPIMILVNRIILLSRESFWPDNIKENAITKQKS